MNYDDDDGDDDDDVAGEDSAEHVPEAQGLCGKPHRPGFNDDIDDDNVDDDFDNY